MADQVLPPSFMLNRFKDLNVTEKSIRALTKLIKDNGKVIAQWAEEWLKFFKLNQDKQGAMLYLVNEIIQTSKQEWNNAVKIIEKEKAEGKISDNAKLHEEKCMRNYNTLKDPFIPAMMEAMKHAQRQNAKSTQKVYDRIVKVLDDRSVLPSADLIKLNLYYCGEPLSFTSQKHAPETSQSVKQTPVKDPRQKKDFGRTLSELEDLAVHLVDTEDLEKSNVDHDNYLRRLSELKIRKDGVLRSLEILDYITKFSHESYGTRITSLRNRFREISQMYQKLAVSITNPNGAKKVAVNHEDEMNKGAYRSENPYPKSPIFREEPRYDDRRRFDSSYSPTDPRGSRPRNYMEHGNHTSHRDEHQRHNRTRSRSRSPRRYSSSYSRPHQQSSASRYGGRNY
uniref:CID domain-containing protein n=1 Tax=Rhabditophanes sp. KR3021 TaxID=114890 RepID=A0AC35TTQ5_9BILA